MLLQVSWGSSYTAPKPQSRNHGDARLLSTTLVLMTRIYGFPVTLRTPCELSLYYSPLGVFIPFPGSPYTFDYLSYPFPNSRLRLSHCNLVTKLVDIAK